VTKICLCAPVVTASRPAVEAQTILLVEDDVLVRASGSGQLAALGYRVVAAEDARGAIEMIEHGCVPDLLFTDVIMPGGMNGRELAEHLHRRHPGLKVL
jgi:CheY-like chemotaxis protein